MAAHCWPGDESNRVAFVFSAPGRIEGENGRPVSGDTGTNMDDILRCLNGSRPDLFPCLCRYYYRITNASQQIIYAAQNQGRTEDDNRAILAESNVQRVLEDISGCTVVILCGDKAQKLKSFFSKKYAVVLSCHFGNKGLRRSYQNNREDLAELSAVERERRRRALCAARILEGLPRQVSGSTQTPPYMSDNGIET